jgi:hypothetical protein
VMERDKDIPSSQEIAGELNQLLDFRETFVTAQNRETQAFTALDSPQLQTRLYEQSYYELYYDTPSKQLLWNAEKLISSVIPEDDYSSSASWKLQKVNLSCLTIDLIEAYAQIMPTEGYDRLQAMSNGPQKVEALARFGNFTDSIFIEQAKDLALQLRDAGVGYFDRYRMFLVIAESANDEKSLDIAYRNLLAERARKPPYGDWDYFETLTEVASLGHLPALLLVKQQLLSVIAQGHSSELEHWIEQAALVEYVDGLVKRHMLPTRVIQQDVSEIEAQQIERDWQKFLLSNKPAIVQVLQKGIQLPRFDALAREFYLHQDDIKNCTSLVSVNDTLEYIQIKTNEYAVQIIQDGPQFVTELLKDTQVADDKYKQPREDIQKEYERFSEEDILSYRSLINIDYSLEKAIAARDQEFGATIPFLNRLALVRGVIAAAKELQARPTNA